MATTVYESRTGLVTVTLSAEENARAQALEAEASARGFNQILTDAVNMSLEREINSRFNALVSRDQEEIKRALTRATAVQVAAVKSALGI